MKRRHACAYRRERNASFRKILRKHYDDDAMAEKLMDKILQQLQLQGKQMVVEIILNAVELKKNLPQL